jgi:hypothetical protein
MFRFKPGVAGGLAVGFAAAFATVFAIATTTPSIVAEASGATQNIVLGIDRSMKSDRGLLNVAKEQTLQKSIVTVEVVGLTKTAIVYKNSAGEILFSTDPVANVTVITKNLTLPEVTIRETNDSTVDEVPLERTKAPRSPLKSGCESGLSPDISPTVPIENGRCIAQGGKSSYVASLN